MNSATNNIAAMVHMQPATAKAEAQAPIKAAPNAPNELESLLEAVARHGQRAARLAEQQLETLQDCFLSLLQTQLKSAGIVLNDKLSIALTDDNKLILQSCEDNEALLNALARDNALQDMFVRLQALAVRAQGIQYLNSSMPEATNPPPANYKMCMKGALSHFYLR